MPKDPKEFDRLFEELPASYREIATDLRDAIRAEAPGLREAIKWNSPFWIGEKDILCLQCYDDHVNLGLLQGADLADAFPEIEGTGRRMRHVKVRDRPSARSPSLRRLIRAAVEHDRRSAAPRR